MIKWEDFKVFKLLFRCTSRYTIHNYFVLHFYIISYSGMIHDHKEDRA